MNSQKPAENYDLESEQCLLGACLLDPKAINDIPGLEVKHLSGNHAAIFKAFQTVKAKAVERSTLSQSATS